MKLASFDLEIAKELIHDQPVENLGISCAALALDPPLTIQGEPLPVLYWYAQPQLNKERCQELVGALQMYTEGLGYKLLTWNGCGFDFKVLAQESGMYKECAELAMNHIDMMLLVTFNKGHYLGLDKALAGAGLAGKKHNVILKDGSELNGMVGALAPKLWAEGETDAVLSYLKEDVLQPLQLAQWIYQNHRIIWQSRTGKFHSLSVPELLTVKECFDLPLPDTSWMADAPKRENFVSWMSQNGK